MSDNHHMTFSGANAVKATEADPTTSELTHHSDNHAVAFVGEDQVEVQPVPRPHAAGTDVLLTVSRTLISAGTECICLKRLFSPGTHWDAWVQYPFYSGYCSAGCVAEVAPTVKRWRVGDRVAAWTNHQRWATSEASRLMAIPENVTDEEAAWTPMGIIAEHGFRKAALQPGESVVVVGLGMLGQLIVQLAQLAGAERIFAIDPAPARVALAESHGATHGLCLGAHEAIGTIREITRGAMAEVAFDMTGHPKAFAATQALLGEFGRLVLVGDTGFPEQQHLTTDFLRNNLTLIGAHQRLAAKLPVWNRERLGDHFLQCVARGSIRVKDLISHRYPVHRAAEAYRLLTTQRDQAMGVILAFE